MKFKMIILAVILVFFAQNILLSGNKNSDQKKSEATLNSNSKNKLNQDFVQEIDSIKVVQKKYLENLEKELAQYPDNIQLRNKLAITYANQNNIKKAEQNFQYLLAKDSTNFKALNNFGNLFFLQGNLDSAQTFYLKAIDNAKDEDKDGILLNLGLVYAAADSESLAVELFAQVLKNSNNYQRIYNLLGICVQEDEQGRGDLMAIKKVSKETVKKLVKKAKKKRRKPKKTDKLAKIVRKGNLPKIEIENVFYWAL